MASSAELRITVRDDASPKPRRRRSASQGSRSRDDDFTRSVKSRTLQIKAKERAQFDAERRLSEVKLEEIFSDFDIELCNVMAGNKGMIIFKDEAAVDAILEGFQDDNNGAPPPVGTWIKAPLYPPWLKLKILVPRKAEETLEAEAVEAGDSNDMSLSGESSGTRWGQGDRGSSPEPLAEDVGEDDKSEGKSAISPPGAASMISVWDVALDIDDARTTSMPVVQSPAPARSPRHGPRGPRPAVSPQPKQQLREQHGEQEL